MAAVDLYGADAGRIRNQYLSSLGRAASDDEVSGWLGGSYGGGGVDDYLRQIDASDEAQRRRQSLAPNPSATPPITNVIPGAQTNQLPSGYSNQPGYGPGGVAGGADQRSGIRNTYRQYLGRDASDDEIDRWLSGGYGYGTGLGAYDRYINAIMGSHEARNYRPAQTTGDGDYQTIEWWQQRGTPAIDIFDPLTGQLRPGWARTARGYERTGGAGTPGATGATTGGPRSRSAADIQPWFSTFTQGKRPSPRTLKEMEPELARHGIRLGPPNARGWTDGIILPDGTFVDVIIGATEDGGQSWGWLVGGGHGGNQGGPQTPGNQYNDPYTQYLEEMMKRRIDMLGQGVNDPYRDQLLSAYQQRANALGNAAEPQYQALIQRLEQRFNDLQGPGYTGAEGEAIRTQALDPIENDRAAARQRVIERLAARGITMESGIAQQALNEVDKAFDGMRATTQTTLATNDVQRREGRQQRADAIKGTLYDIPQARAREQLDVFSAMEMLESIMRQEEDARGREQISLAGGLADLGPQRLQLAMQAAGMGGNPTSNFSSLMQLANLNQQSQLLNMNRSSQLWSGLGSIAAILANSGR
jgi:hypothetical protein